MAEPRESGAAYSSAAPVSQPLPRNARVLGLVSLLNDVASEMVYPLLPGLLLSTLGVGRLYLAVIEGAAESLASFLKLASGAWSDRLRKRKPLVISGLSNSPAVFIGSAKAK